MFFQVLYRAKHSFQTFLTVVTLGINIKWDTYYPTTSQRETTFE